VPPTVRCVREASFAGYLFLTCACSGPSDPSGRSCEGPYPDQATSPYILPWRVAETYRVGQGNCGSGSHAAGTVVQYAYDFLMPINTPVVAARSGTWIRGEISMKQVRSCLVQNTGVHAPCVQVDAAVMLMGTL
jgi:hypothetical protein